jgi:glutathione S-transferase
LESRLADHEYLAGEYSIADIANWSWVSLHFWAGVDVEDLPNLQRWMKAVSSRPAVQRGIVIPEPLVLDDGGESVKEMARSMLVGGDKKG